MSVVSNNTLLSITSILVDKSYIADLFTKLAFAFLKYYLIQDTGYPGLSNLHRSTYSTKI